ncbi:hypothetical protein HPP92_017490 [Vanilla planifolia]|uniref:Mini-chromosome maintenance complex-binding protein n=1 Tax=Vanilla planifolia TaxID=51239 RepID=A0A835QI47_VANPL|nr:hypothetical protein HPP92_017490 [Vanilla planifolia]
MVGLPYDCVANPLGAVRLTFEKAVAGLPDADPMLALGGKDWGVTDLFHRFLFEEDGLSRVPILDQSSIRWIMPNTLVRFRGMVQDMLGNELYIGAFKDGSTWRTNKFTDVAARPMPPSCQSCYSERLIFLSVPVPGQNQWTLDASPPQVVQDKYEDVMSQHGEKRRRDVTFDAMELNVQHMEMDASCSKKQREDEYTFQSSHSLVKDLELEGVMQENKNHSDDASFSCLVKVYDLPEGHLKLNDVFEFIGVYTFNPELFDKDGTDHPAFDIVEDVSDHLPPTKVPRLHCLICKKLAFQDFLSVSSALQPLPNPFVEIRGSLIGHLSAILGNDEVAAQCLLLHLLSRVRGKVDVVTVGKLSLNLTGFTRESASLFGSRLNDMITSLLPFSRVIPISVDYLNKATLQPRKNNQTGRLMMGELQLAHGTHLTLDETHLQAGVLSSVGVENARMLKYLMEMQSVEYDFEFYKLDMTTDIQLLVISEGKSNILPADLVLPFHPTSYTPKTASREQLEAWRWYLANARSLNCSSGLEMQTILQDEMVAAMREDQVWASKI